MTSQEKPLGLVELSGFVDNFFIWKKKTSYGPYWSQIFYFILINSIELFVKKAENCLIFKKH